MAVEPRVHVWLRFHLERRIGIDTVIVVEIVVGTELLRIRNLVIESDSELIRCISGILQYGYLASAGIGDSAIGRHELAIKRRGGRIKAGSRDF